MKQPHIAGLEKSTGDKLPSVPLLAALAEVFGVSMPEVAGLEPVDQNTPNLLRGLRAEDRALVNALVSRLGQDNIDMLDDNWDLLNRTASDDLHDLFDDEREPMTARP